MSAYVESVRKEIACAATLADCLQARLDRDVDSIYLGGGTPTTLSGEHLRQTFRTIRSEFNVSRDAEITVECAPGTLSIEMIEVLREIGCNRVSLGTQSFVDREIRSVGRLHTAQQARSDVAFLRRSGICNINLDLIAGLPYQTAESWRASLEFLVDLQVPHASIYMLEVDEDSRLGRELIAGGERYHAHHVPDSDLAADMYEESIDRLRDSGFLQYEISNFSRPGYESKHNLKYWTRQPYLGFGLDAHSMLPAKEPSPAFESVRFGNTDELDAYLAGTMPESVQRVDRRQASEENLFLGLRLNAGIDLSILPADGEVAFPREIEELEELELVECSGTMVRLTRRGRLLSNEVFQRFIDTKAYA